MSAVKGVCFHFSHVEGFRGDRSYGGGGFNLNMPFSDPSNSQGGTILSDPSQLGLTGQNPVICHHLGMVVRASALGGKLAM